MQNNILYTGIVSIFYKRHPISITYNAGTSLFLNNICNTLRGEEKIGFQQVVPQYMSLLVQDENCTQDKINAIPDYSEYVRTNNSVLIHPISITSRYVKDASIVFASMLSSNLVNTSVYNDSKKYNKGFIVLLNAYQQILAYSKVSLNDLEGVLSTSNVQTQANIEWKLNFANSNLLEAK